MGKLHVDMWRNLNLCFMLGLSITITVLYGVFIPQNVKTITNKASSFVYNKNHLTEIPYN